MIKNILLPLDGSELAECVLPYVEDLASCLKAKVYFVHVVDKSLVQTFTATGEVYMLDPKVMADANARETAEAQTRLSFLANEWQAKGIDVTTEVIDQLNSGSPGRSLIEYAHSHAIDLIAMSTHGRSGLNRLVFGSVAEEVVRGDHGIPVLLVKPTDD